MSQETTAGEKALYLVLGAAIGATAALLLAPQSGEETRKLILTKAREGADTVASQSKTIADTVASQTKTVTDKTTEYVDRGKEIVQQQRDSLSAAIDAGKKAYREDKEKA